MPPEKDIRFLSAIPAKPSEAIAESDVFQILAPQRQWRKNRQDSIEFDVKTLLNVLDDNHAAHDTAVFIPSAGFANLEFVLEFLARHKGRCKFFPRIFDIAVFDDLSDEKVRDLLGYMTSGDITLLTETHCLKNLIHKTFDIDSVRNFILPCSASIDNIVPPTTQQDQPAGPTIKVGCLGALRAEKGKYLIPEILGHLAKKLSKTTLDKPIELVLPHHKKLRPLWDNFKYSFDLFYQSGNIPFPNKQLMVTRHGPLRQDADFIRLLDEMDILLLPYDAKKYPARGSGIVIDGVLTGGKAYVHVKGMGMADLLSCGNAESASSAEEYADKIIHIAQDIAPYRAGAIRAQDLILKQFRESAQLLNEVS